MAWNIALYLPDLFTSILVHLSTLRHLEPIGGILQRVHDEVGNMRSSENRAPMAGVVVPC